MKDRIAWGPIPLDETLPIARQIADALEAAHEQGIIHRDLKPSNIKVRPDGRVKVLDFGIAKAIEVRPGSSDVSESPTITSPAMTRLGMVLGTPAYMSPEQARGHQADRRSDVWAFGCVLYEMLTGMQAFGALTPTDTIAAIVKGDPDWTRLPPALPQGMARVLRRCLAKDPRQRFRDIADVRLDIADALAESPLRSAGEATSPRTDWRHLAAAAIAGCLIGAVAVALVDRFTTRQASPAGRTQGVVRLTLPLAERERLVGSREESLVARRRPRGSLRREKRARRELGRRRRHRLRGWRSLAARTGAGARWTSAIGNARAGGRG